MSAEDQQNIPPELIEVAPALGMSGAELSAAHSPSIDHLLAMNEPKVTIMGPDGHRVLVRERRLSRNVNKHPLGVAGLDRARNEDRGPATYAETVEMLGEDRVRELEASSDPRDRARAGCARLEVDPSDNVIDYAGHYPDRLLLNTSRPPQPLLPGGREYTLEDLRAHDSKRCYYEGPHVQERIAAEERVCQLDYERVRAAGAPDRVVVIHNQPEDVCTEAHPVPVMSTPLRIVRLLWRETAESGFAQCWWCEEWQDTEIDAMMVVTCGPTTRVFPTCPTCEEVFKADLGDGVDFVYVSDRRFFQIGLPSDEYLPDVTVRLDGTAQ
ncbi:hypothetical protein [Tsukamurella pseudospumae]|uniref:Uncharacterized protein n=1 Tax=Tsukamurella pseudospumae TaxID=239498 RepID=A0A137YZI1_9ACTN|nr:hypothetical protein [Tsukamurella pseudospumae]KXO91298.1 hypothetical protein AXK61_07020 [Tsukamurella pseudospumae]